MTPPHPASFAGALLYGALLAAAALFAAGALRRLERRLAARLDDVTALRFVAALARALVYLLAVVLFAQLVPALRAMGTALFAGVSLVSLVVGLAAQNTLANLVAGFALVLYRPLAVGDRLLVTTPAGPMEARVVEISLGHTRLVDDQGREVVMPNSILAGSTVVRLPTEPPAPPSA
ncbi:MAG: hypothetical protein KatS3mg124_0016 [Porticoccaceae bacterium]|nr:MAG: hypothetical protein KatS3mg124_0016 [Porticoccaceae bacterium]